MTNEINIFESDHLTHVPNYSGVFQTGVGYNKFDFVYNTGDGLFYYARENMLYGGGMQISGANRLSIIPEGPYTNEGQTHYIVDLDNQLNLLELSFEVGQIVTLEGSTQDNDGIYKVLSVEHDVYNVNGDASLTGAVMNVVGFSDSDKIESTELASSNPLNLQEIEITPEDNSSAWSKDLFFFDADYGSTVNFRTNNHKYEYGNGYYILQPKNINSITMEASLKFKNRTNREANAMIHFLENHQGQHEQYDNTANLRYNQGIAGFRWDGNATFHPYDSTEVQSKKFTSSEWNHSLNFENSNDIDVKIRNLDSSILQKNNGLFVYPAEEYSDSEYYEKNDIVYSSVNKSFYYWSGNTSAAGMNPVEAQSSWTREDGYFKDTNPEYWTRDFFWKPSLGLSVNQKPRLNQIALGAGYTQTFSDGINESLLTLDLSFNNRSDSEARAILHFLEQHYGCTPFNFIPPAPYNTEQNFVCQEWSHTYNYKNNHSISAKFEQYPFNFSAQQYESSVTPSPEAEGELVFTSPFVMKVKDVGQELSLDTNFRARLLLKNIGDKSITLNTATLYNLQTNDDSSVFYVLGQENGNVPLIKKTADRQFQLPAYGTGEVLSNTDETINLYNKEIRLRKTFAEGIDGGYIFDVVEPGGQSFIQYNNGLIRDLSNKNITLQTDYFINTIFIQNQNNAPSVLTGGEQAHIEIVFKGVNQSQLTYNLLYMTEPIKDDQGVIQTESEIGGSIVGTALSGDDFNVAGAEISRYYSTSIIINSSSLYGSKTGRVKVYVNT